MERYEAYKDSGVDWIGEIPAEWEVVPLKSSFVFGKGLPITKADLLDEGVPVISYGQIHSKANNPAHVNDSLIRFVSRTYLETSPVSLTMQGDFLFADTSEDVEGSGSFVYHDRSDEIFAGYHTLILSPNDCRQGRYFSYLFQSDEWRGQIRSRVSGVKLFSLTQRILGDVGILLPSHCEQTNIADYLDSATARIDELVEDCEREVELLQEYRKAIISEAVTKGLDPNAPMKDSGVEWIGEIPNTWKVFPSKALFRESKELRHSADKQCAATQKYGIIPQDEYTALENQRMVAADKNLEMWKHVEPGDFVISLRSFQGGLELSRVTGCVTWHYIVLKKGPAVDPGYYKYLFKTQRYIEALQRTCTYIRDGQDLRYSNFVQVPLPLPDLCEQRRIAGDLDEITAHVDSLIDAKQQMADKLREYRKSLISEAVTGKFRVPGAE